MKKMVIGILAHVDSGKTTLSEALLYLSGKLRKLGRVDHRDAFLDTFDLERERGITIFSKQARLTLGDTEITLLDTPGHVDFSPEMERTLQVLDYAVLVISGTDGVQSHTETLWRLLERHHIPTFLFINKMDLAGTDRTALLEQLRTRFGDGCIDFSDAPDLEQLALCDDALMEQYLDAGVLEADAVTRAIAARRVFPCCFGAALKTDGVAVLLDRLEAYTRQATALPTFAARVFKIARDEQGARLTYLKILGGTLRVRDTVSGDGWSEKVNQIRLYAGAKYETADQVTAGDVCAVTGLTETHAGDALGAAPPAAAPQLEPVLTYRVELPAGIDAHTALTRLRQLEEEEPQLHIVWQERSQEIHLQLMGEVQLEILQRLIADRFHMAVTFGQGSIVYKETIADTVEGIGHFEPLRHYAEVHLLLAAGERGSGVRFFTACSEDVLDRNWQRLILTHLAEKPHLGVLTGSPVTDLRITLLTGRAHAKHTEGGDFRQATYRAVRQGLRQAQSVLLEPMYAFRLRVPSENLGRAMTDLQRRGGALESPETDGDCTLLTGTAPVACLRDYQTEVAGYTRGRGQLSCTPCGYAPCHNAEEVIAAIGYDCDSDLENTADSVFCAHGAGYNVKWNEVRAHAHLDSGFGRPVHEDEPVAQRRAAAYQGAIEEDRELLAIFERTYGPIRRDNKYAFAPVKKTPLRLSETPPAPPDPEYLLVDGYNIIFAWDDLAEIARTNLDAAREKLTNMLCNYRAYRRVNLILVFDAYKVKGSLGSVQRYHNIDIVYTKEAETADTYIERATHELDKKYRVRVATSDGLVQLIILGHDALRLSARQFREEVDQTEQAIRALLTQR